MVAPLTLGHFEGESLPAASTALNYAEYKARIWKSLPASVATRVTGLSWVPTCPVPKTDLSYLQLTHWNMAHTVSTGELNVHHTVAYEITQIFASLFQQRFPIERMRLIDYYNADDDLSMADNNSSAFCARAITDRPGVWSNHSYGRAIDINPRQNPFHNPAKKTVPTPEKARYLDRTQTEPGMIYDGDACCSAFRSHGWSWGGHWTRPIDYQHFEKPLPS